MFSMHGSLGTKRGQDHVLASGVFVLRGKFWHIPQAGSAAGGVYTLLSFVLYLYHMRDTTCTTSGGASGREHERAKLHRITMAFVASSNLH